MTRPLTALLVTTLTLGLAGCGSDDTKPPRTTDSPAQAAVRAKRRIAEQPHLSPASVTQEVAAAPSGRQRRDLIRALRRSVLRDARARDERGELDGPFRGTSCEITRDDEKYAKANPDAPILRYDCVAVTYRSKTMEIGKMFVARVDFARNRYAWCLRTPVGGEGAHQSEIFEVEPSPTCVAPPGLG